MNPFHTIAVPHSDISEGRLTQEVFAADLWEVFKNRGPDEYKDADRFFKKTYETEGLKHLLSVIEGRLIGHGGDPVIRIQTPFGGGKTHALIAMYHRAVEWNAQRAVLVGTPLAAGDTLWGTLEAQLTGKISRFAGLTSPGRDALYELLLEHQPLLILMDEVLEYMTKAEGVRVQDSTLASQTRAFMHELTEVPGILEKVALVFTLPSGALEHYGEGAEQLFMQLQHVAGRVENIHTPVEDHEITQVIRRRLFSRINKKRAREVIGNFVDYAVKESILPPGTEPSEYRKRFEASYPFQPEVIDILYQRWGSFSSFQRTRGVLRLLALIIHSLKEKAIPYISLADFNLRVQGIRQELLKHIGDEFDSIVAADITGDEAGAKKVDLALGDAYKGLKLGSRTATTVFLYSFSGVPENGASLGEIKRSATTTGNLSSGVTEAVEGLREKLFYLRHDRGKVYFTNQPNLNHILLTRMENIKESEINDSEEMLLRRNLSQDNFKVFKWPRDGSEVSDNPNLKIVILKQSDDSLMQAILETKGSTPRVNRNLVFFLTTLANERSGFYNQLRKTIAYQSLSKTDSTLNLSPEQKRHVQTELKTAENELNAFLHRYYRTLFIPAKGGLQEMDLGVPTYGETKKLDAVVYDKLRSTGELLEQIPPRVLKERYLKNNDTVSTKQLYQSSAKTPGESRTVNQSAWESGMREGIEQGMFGLGKIEAGKPVCQYYKETPLLITFDENEVIIRAEICSVLKEKRNGEDPPDPPDDPPDPPPDPPDPRTRVRLKFTVPQGQVSSLTGMMHLLQGAFNTLQIELVATDGEISEQDYEDKIKEALDQLGIDPDSATRT